MSAIVIWNPDLELVGHSDSDVWDDDNPFRKLGWVEYPATILDATETLGRHITDLLTLSTDELVEVAKTVVARKGSEKPETIKEILARVGTDKDLAAAALETEKESAEPRKTLVADLEGILAAE